MQGLDFHKKRRRPAVRIRKVKEAVLWAVEILIVCMAAVFLVAAFGQRVSVAGDSMSPKLRNGDVALVNRLIYHFAGPSRGDIIVFQKNGDAHYSAKRVVGLPGETVQIKDGQILINGETLTKDVEVSDIAYSGLAEEPVELAADEYFVLGDNHTASNDSRVPEVGNVKADEIYGLAWFVAGPLEDIGFIR